MRALLLTAFCALASAASSMNNTVGYPKVNVKEFTGVAIGSNLTTAGWGLNGNFYVVTDYPNALLKFGVSLGITPNGTWQKDAVYQSYIQLLDTGMSNASASYFNNLVCNLVYNVSPTGNVSFTASVQNSCGFRQLSSFPNVNVRHTAIQGENTTCANPWYQSTNLTGFIVGTDKLNYAACSFYRYFTAPNAMTLKVSDTLNYLVGFNVFPSVNATTIVARGNSTQL